MVAKYGDALAGKILVDISNPFNADASGLVTTTGNSAAQENAAAAPEGTHVGKALNSIFGRVLASVPTVPTLSSAALRRLHSGGRPTWRFAGCGTRRPPTHELSLEARGPLRDPSLGQMCRKRMVNRTGTWVSRAPARAWDL